MTPETETSKQATGRAPTDDLWEAIYTQRAIRYWQPRPVPRPLLERVIEAATKAPSGSNTQPWIFVVVDDDDCHFAISQVNDNIEYMESQFNLLLVLLYTYFIYCMS